MIDSLVKVMFLCFWKNNDYPFGQALPYRNGNTPEYRYGYQGSEKDPEIKGEGNSYTTEFRQLDPRIGRWLSLDPKMAYTPWESPYVSMGNNPVWFNDPLGDEFKKPRHAEKLKKKAEARGKEIDSKIAETQSKIDANQQKLNDPNTPKSDIESIQASLDQDNIALENLNFMKGEMVAMISEIDKMAISKVLFVTRRSFRPISAVTYAKSATKVMIKFQSYSDLSHEFAHGYQYLLGEVATNNRSANTFGSNGIYDLHVELRAFRRNYAFSPGDRQFSNIESYNGIQLQNVHDKFYKNLGFEELNLQNTLLDKEKWFFVPTESKLTR